MESLAVKTRINIVSLNTSSGSSFGPGVAMLCKGVRDHGSLYAAAREMKMAYSKAWRIMRDTEQALGVTLIDRDGPRGSTLTQQGDRLLDAYEEISKKTSRYAQDLLKEVFA